MLTENEVIDDYDDLRESEQQLVEDAELGYGINIPYFKIFEEDGKTLRLNVNSGDRYTYMKVDLSLANPDNNVEWELWYSSYMDLTANVLSELGKYQKPFAPYTTFTPRIVTFDCENCPRSVRERDCVSDGKYCPLRPSSDKERLRKGYTGVSSSVAREIDTEIKDHSMHDIVDEIPDSDIIMEALRDKCIYKLVNAHKSSKLLKRFFNYLFIMHGLTSEKAAITEKMVDRAATFAGLQLSEIQECVNNSFVEPGNF